MVMRRKSRSFPKSRNDHLKGTVQELKGMIDRLEKENRELKRQLKKSSKELENEERFLKKHVKHIKVKDVIADLEDEKIVDDCQENFKHAEPEKCPTCGELLKELKIPHGYLYLCQGKKCTYRKTVKI